MTTYLHRNVEVIETGRTAVKQRKSLRKDKEPTESILHEVKPKDPQVGSWTDWVRLSDLYIVQETKDEEDQSTP